MTTQIDFQLTPAQVKSLWNSMSTPRLNRYKTAAGGDDKDAIELYCWNLALSQAFYWPLHSFEISLRNALSGILRVTYGSDWTNRLDRYSTHRGSNSNKETEQISKAKAKLTEKGHAHSHDNIVAATSLGLWHGLFKQEYEKSYIPLIFPAFLK